MKLSISKLFDLSPEALEEGLNQFVKRERLEIEVPDGFDIDPLNGIVADHLRVGGKRLRARLSLDVIACLGANPLDFLPWAAVCELLHNGTLVHDDIQDGDRLRRGQPTVWTKVGIPQAINVGDLLLVIPNRILYALKVSDSIKWKLSHAVSRAAENVVRGQAMEMNLTALVSKNIKVQLLTMSQLEGSYFSSIEHKTSALFELPVFGSALIAGLPESEASDLAACFKVLGSLFQIQDDVLDLYGDKGRGFRGSDIKEGKLSALVVQHLKLYSGEFEKVMTILTTGRDETSDKDVESLIEDFQNRGALRNVLKIILHQREQFVGSQTLRSYPKLYEMGCDLIDVILKPISHVLSEHKL